MNATPKSSPVPLVLVALMSATALAQTKTADQPRPLPKPDVGQRYALIPTEEAQQPTDPKSVVGRLLAEARGAIAVGDTNRATQLVSRASQLGVPETAFGSKEDSPARLAMELRQQPQRRHDPAVANAAAHLPALDQAFNQVSPAVHYPELDGTSNQAAAALVHPGSTPRLAQLPSPPELIQAERGGQANAARALAQGEQKLREGDLDGALDRFRAADTMRGELDPNRRTRLDDHLRMLTSGAALAAPPTGVSVDASMIEKADEDQRVLARQLQSALGDAQAESREIRDMQPRRSLELLEEVKAEIAKSGVNEVYRAQLTRVANRAIVQAKKYIEDNRAQIELDEANESILAEIDRENTAKLKQQEKIAELVEQFNSLLDEQSYAEAEVVAKRLYALAPENAVTKQIMVNARMIRRNMFNADIRDARDEGNWSTLAEVDGASVIDVGDGREMVFDKDWESMTKSRRRSDNRGGRFNNREKQIKESLGTQVKLQYSDRPLAEVMASLSRMAGADIYLDPRGLNQEGVSTDTPVSIELNNEISLKSALNLILAPLNLAYTIKDEVLMVTSEALREGDVFTETYYVADLVIPIPNFVPSNNIGLQGLINDALAVTGYGGGGMGAPGPMAFANNAPMPGAGGNPNALGQQFDPTGGGGGIGMSPTQSSVGPGGLGGAASADFDSLIELIQTTVAVDTWAANGGGEGAEIAPFPTNLSLVVSQTQSVHEEIADLLDQLRRLQDLQVTIEVRFIRLSDDFFERIGIDFDMNINDSILGTDEITQTSAGSFTQEIVSGDIARTRGGATVGVQSPLVGDLATVTADLDLPFRQGSFNVAQPTVGGFNPSTAATFGFAILSDIEAYFLINAAQGDSRTNVLNAPKVTLFNGQQAFVSDTSQSPFVISVVPVVGEFAAAQQPVIVVLSEGTMMSIQAVVSEDRRYVRLTVVPFFSEIGDVDTFVFDGSTTTGASASSATTDNDDDGTNEQANSAQNQQITTAGTTVQLPTFQFVSVTTTVSVPDGGTVLLGGIKRLSEGREEFGVPLLSKLPYINRLFRNVGIGRETDSLMMMVTPRIIIQEEEEERLGLLSP